MTTVSVAIPVRNGGPRFVKVLDAVLSQHVDGELDLVVADSSSTDGSLEAARGRGARVLSIADGEFGHGRTRNELLAFARGSHVAFLTQDSLPADERWLARLLAAFDLAPDVALAYGPYRPQPDASCMVARELTTWFQSFSPDGSVRVDRLEGDGRRDTAPSTLLGPVAYFTDANGCIAREAWERVPFPDVPYAEDHALALAMLREGYAKAFVPAAAVEHSHDYAAWDLLRRSFDESRGLLEVYGWRPPLGVSALRSEVIGAARADARWARASGERRTHLYTTPLRALGHRALRFAGTQLGARADRMPAPMRTWLSLERRSSFQSSVTSHAV